MTDPGQSAEAEVRCILVPAGEHPLLVPGACVAEIVSAPVVENATSVPDWLSGYTVWRGQRIPVLSWGRLNRIESGDGDASSRAVVLNPMPETAGSGFWALSCGDDIRPVVVYPHTQGAIRPEGLDSRYVAASVSIDDSVAIIPAMSAIGMLLKVL